MPFNKPTPSSVVYWSRLLLAIAVAFACHILRIVGYYGVGLAISAFILSCVLIRYSPSLWGSMGKKYKFITTGIGTYFLAWSMVLILLNTLQYG
ncbi:MAG: hypothetical protein QXU06_04395 [Candidatus Bathyarchaeia archaeon]